MSYEGYEQCICTNGHYFEKDAYDTNDLCPACHVKIAWSNSVDQTNCEEYGVIPYKMLEESYLICLTTIFRIPNKEDTDKLRHWRPYNDDEEKLLPVPL